MSKGKNFFSPQVSQSQIAGSMGDLLAINNDKNIFNELTNMAESVYSFAVNSLTNAKSKDTAMRLLKRSSSDSQGNSRIGRRALISRNSSSAISANKISSAAESSSEGDLSNTDELTLIKRAQAGNKECFRVLVEKYESRLIRCAYNVIKNPEEARDIVQDAFVKAYLALPKFKGDSSFYTWMYRIVLHLSIDLKRKYARRGGDALEFDEKIGKEVGTAGFDASRNDQPDEILYRRQQLSHVQKALNEISPEHKEIIMMREVEGFSYDEISSILGISLGTVMSRLFYGRKALMNLIGKFSKEPAA